ncbi:proline racemase family protein [Viridibacillus sp. NPDC093762]|uniref:proline racemase family protein n=1 Tax=Viridibacillus sp. NPDC093762 TaxID=3390720 RepID=UPI003D049AFD
MNICGHGTIGTVTMYLSKGIIPKKEFIYIVSPSGIIECRATYIGDSVENVEFTNVPAFLLHKEIEIDLKSIGKVSVDIAFGGSFFGIINAVEFQLEIDLINKQQILGIATEARDFINGNIVIQHPTIPGINTVDLIEISSKVSEDHYKLWVKEDFNNGITYLMLLYPIAIALIILIFTDSFFKGAKSVNVGTIIGVGFIAVIDVLKEANLGVETLNNTFNFMPLFTSGAGWIITGIIGANIGYFFRKEKIADSADFEDGLAKD